MSLNYEKITSHFGHIFPTHVDALCELLIVLRKQFMGDLDLMLILAIIGSRALPARQSSSMTYAEFISDERENRIVQPINIQSIAECSGIARETVRRKVKKLEELGLVERNSEGMLAVTAKSIEQLKPATEASLQYLVALSAAAEKETRGD